MAGQIKRRDDIHKENTIPDGITIQSDEEKTLWSQYTASRSHDLWREIDLLNIAKMVKLEMRIRNAEAILDEVGIVIENKRGTMVENPVVRVIDTFTRQHLAIFRSLGLGIASDNSVALNNTGVKSKEKEEVKKQKSGKVVDLLA